MHKSAWILGLLIVPSVALAHSGGLDFRGGHHCRTDCEKHGMLEGQYHFHQERMDSGQLQSFSRLRGALCKRVMKRFSDNAEMMARVQERIQKRFGLTCTEDKEAGKDYLGYYTFAGDKSRRAVSFQRQAMRDRSETAYVTRVIDGDTIEVREQDGSKEIIRIIGIDAPELRAFRDLPQCFSHEALGYLRNLLVRDEVELIPKPGENRDKYGRLLRYVHHNGNDIGTDLLVHGYARNFPWFEHPRADVYDASEEEAKKALSGLWGKCR